NIVQTHISRIERGLSMPSVELLIQLVQTLEIPNEELLFSLGLSDDKLPLLRSEEELKKSLLQFLDMLPGLSDEQRQKVRGCLDDQMELARLRRHVRQSGEKRDSN
ncbi:MAG: helix-turn-helix domain-containing protein, partial [Pyramidobacter sp.]